MTRGKPSRTTLAFLAALLAGAALRAWGLGWGFPLLLDGDEPHFVNLAVSFGSGNLNPGQFKYPTLWMYVLFAAFGVKYLLWSGFGLLHTTAEYGCRFVNETWTFYALGRALAVACSVGGLAAVWASERRLRGDKAFPWAAGMLAVSPSLVYSAHEAKPDSLLFLLSALAWLFAIRGRLRLCGLFAGLGFAAHYTALPLFLLPALAHALGEKRGPPSRVAAAYACAGAGVFLGAPFLLLDFPAFKASLAERAAYEGLAERDFVGTGLAIAALPLGLAGPWSAAPLGLAAGAWTLGRDRGRLLALLVLPFLAYGAFLATKRDSGQARYFYACLPALALLAAEGLESLRARAPKLAPALALWAVLPGLAACAGIDRWLSTPDTRVEATRWIEANLPAGAGLLLDQPDASPAPVMDASQAREFFERMRRLGSRRARWYELLWTCHPGGGYKIFRLKRSASDLGSIPAHVERSQREGPYVEVDSLRSARKLGVRYVVTSSFGYKPGISAPLDRFFGELVKRGKPIKEFAPDHRSLSGPVVTVYEI